MRKLVTLCVGGLQKNTEIHWTCKRKNSQSMTHAGFNKIQEAPPMEYVALEAEQSTGVDQST
jgi:hypothetical protein